MRCNGCPAVDSASPHIRISLHSYCIPLQSGPSSCRCAISALCINLHSTPCQPALRLHSTPVQTVYTQVRPFSPLASASIHPLVSLHSGCTPLQSVYTQVRSLSSPVWASNQLLNIPASPSTSCSNRHCCCAQRGPWPPACRRWLLAGRGGLQPQPDGKDSYLRRCHLSGSRLLGF